MLQMVSVSGKTARRVLIAQSYVPQYRAAFFERLRSRLSSEGVHLDLVFGDPTDEAAKKSDAVRIEWAYHLPNRHIGVGSYKLTYQPIVCLSRTYDLVIVEQANKFIVNPILMCLSRVGNMRLAYWGHGKDFQGNDKVLSRVIKRALVPHVHWWFAYNELSAAVVRKTGFPDQRITRVMNTIDNYNLDSLINEVTDQEVDEQRKTLGIRGNNVCIYVGGMYEKKRLRFLLAACERVRQKIPDFEIVIVGGGVDKPIVDRFSSDNKWAIVVGPKFGHDKAVILKLSKLLLMPGLVGLAIIDAFTAETPIVTTNVSFHSPEIDYLIDGVNGEMVQNVDSVDEYADRIVELLQNRDRLAVLRNGCRAAAKVYTLNAMVDRFAAGILNALKT